MFIIWLFISLSLILSIDAMKLLMTYFTLRKSGAEVTGIVIDKALPKGRGRLLVPKVEFEWGQNTYRTFVQYSYLCFAPFKTGSRFQLYINITNPNICVAKSKLYVISNIAGLTLFYALTFILICTA
jgi:hypothetical protein